MGKNKMHKINLSDSKLFDIIGKIYLAGEVSVGTFNTFLYRGTPAFQQRKNLLIRTVSKTHTDGLIY